MSKTLNIEAIKLMQENKFEEAYDAFSKLIEEHKNNYEAIYFRAIVDFGHLKKHFETTLEDLSHLAMFKNPYQIPSVQIVTIMYDMNDNYDMVIIYGEKAVKLIENYNNTPVDLKIDIYYALARAYFHKKKQVKDENLALFTSFCGKNFHRYNMLCFSKNKKILRF